MTIRKGRGITIEMEKISIDNQLLEVRTNKHNNFVSSKQISPMPTNDVIANVNNEIPTQKSWNEWHENTTLIVGDSLISGLLENKMGTNVKVRSFSGALVKDLHNYLIPLLKKRPSNIILMAGTNDAVMSTSTAILQELLLLKVWIIETLPGVNVCISCPTVCWDNSKAKITIHHLRNKLSGLNIDYIANDNIHSVHIGQKGLHLNGKGSGRLAMNYLSHIRHKH